MIYYEWPKYYEYDYWYRPYPWQRIEELEEEVAYLRHRVRELEKSMIPVYLPTITWEGRLPSVTKVRSNRDW